jgi:hypothetical protein
MVPPVHVVEYPTIPQFVEVTATKSTAAPSAAALKVIFVLAAVPRNLHA